MRKTIDSIVKACAYPLSIIIIGIGDEDFSNMEILDADDIEERLLDSKGNEATRDIVQFVKYNDFCGDIGILAEKVLGEVPDQVVDYIMEYAADKSKQMKKANSMISQDSSTVEEGSQE